MSNSGPSVAATRAVSAASRLTPMAHIAGLDDGGVAGGGLDLGLVGGGESGGADDMDEAGLRGQRGEGNGRGGGLVKSSTPSTWAKTGRGSSVMATPTGLRPATSPMSRPI